ncbi:MAG: DUF2919 family protein [Gammaproteobacteria bacterium]
MANQYPFSAYDKYLCLKPDFSVWLVLVFLLRPYVVVLLSIANRKDHTGLINLVYSDRLAMILAAIAAIPAIFVVYAFIKRKPDAPDKVRRIWQHGRELLLGSSFLNVLVVFLPLLTGIAREISTVGWAQFGISAYIIYYLFTERRVRDTFADFPQPAESDRK